MMSVEDILAIPPGDWTPEQLEVIKAFVRSYQLVKTPARVSPSSAAGFPSLLTNSDCAIARYFKENPGETLVLMTCSCRFCIASF